MLEPARLSDVPHPIPYQGSKRRIAGIILGYFPAGGGGVLYEPFAGSAAITIAAAARNAADRFVVSDLNKPLIDLWDEIVRSPERVADEYERLWNDQLGRERAYYDEVRRRFNLHHQPAHFLYLLARCVKGAVRYNAAGEFNQGPDNRRLGMRPATLRVHVRAASALLSGITTFRAGDYREILTEATPDDLIYLDPPYQGVSFSRDSRYLAGLTFEGFVASLAELNSRNLSYIVSYDGTSGPKKYGRNLPEDLDLLHLAVDAGRSTSGTLLGRDQQTIESLYLSEALVARLRL